MIVILFFFFINFRMIIKRYGNDFDILKSVPISLVSNNTEFPFFQKNKVFLLD